MGVAMRKPATPSFRGRVAVPETSSMVKQANQHSDTRHELVLRSRLDGVPIWETDIHGNGTRIVDEIQRVCINKVPLTSAS